MNSAAFSTNPNAFQWLRQERASDAASVRDPLFTQEKARAVRAFHQSIPEYRKTDLKKLDCLAEALGVSQICVKDESTRFGLNAFKGLGGSYCMASCLADRFALSPDQMTFPFLTSGEMREQIKELTFVTATDGNHGRGIAWTAHRLGVKSVVLMPKGSAAERLANIQKLGADAWITDVNYDDTVRMARKLAEDNGWTLVQDTSWDGYEEIPTRIMQGYLTMALEAAEDLDAPPTHIFLQAGVGSMAGALAGFFADYYREARPIITIVEPNQADCLFRTASARDGKLHTVGGSLSSIMAGLSCGEPCPIAWEVLQAHADFFVSMPDYVAAQGMRILGNPTGTDARIISGESGASTLGLAAELLRNPELEPLRKEMALDGLSRILCISTEGDTDQENYRRIVWDGAWHR